MARTPRRGGSVPRLESLEPRRLLDGAGAGSPPPALVADVADRLFVKFEAGIPADRISADLVAAGASLVSAYPDGTDLVAVAHQADRTGAIASLSAEPGVVYAQADAAYHTTAVYPDNPDFLQEWGENSTNDVDIDAPEAWSVTTGSPSTIVAVLDTGIDLNNPAFSGRIWTNPNPAGDPSYPDDVNGWNFVSNTSDVQDDNGHGTHVSGILAATGNDATGVAGVNWQAQIMPVKVLDSHGYGSTDAAVAGIFYAVQHGAKVINASWGGGPYSQAMADAIRYADGAGVVFVTAAGNDGTDSDVAPSYPGSYGIPNEIVVAAADQAGNLASFSDYGPHTVDLAAPGVDVLSTIPGGFASWSGTSMSTPFVSGVVSLLAGLYPQWNAEQLKARVVGTTKPEPGLAGLTISGGIVDAAQAVGVAGSGQNGGGPIEIQALAPPAAAVLHPTVKHVKAVVHKVAKPKPAPKPKVVVHHPAKLAHRAATILGRRDLPGPAGAPVA